MQQHHNSGTNTVTRHVSAPVDRPVAPSSNGLPPGQNICASCERLIVGVFVRIKDKNLHADCFKCATCGTSLKNQGYFSLNDKLYCDIHARLAALNSPPPGMNGMVPVTVTKPGQKTGVQAISAALNAHANLNGRSQSPYGNNGSLGASQSPSHSRSSSTTSSTSGYCNSSSLSPVQSNKVSPLHSRTSSENELIDPRTHGSPGAHHNHYHQDLCRWRLHAGLRQTLQRHHRTLLLTRVSKWHSTPACHPIIPLAIMYRQTT